jgi:tetratricopeptide (TPR) repeat protein
MRIACCRHGLLAAGLVLAWAAAPASASRPQPRDPCPLREADAEPGSALLVRYYQDLPRRRLGEKPAAWAGRLQAGLNGFKRRVAERYREEDLRRLLDSRQAGTRRAAVVAVGLTGTIASNRAVAALLHDDDYQVRQLAADALWLLWFGADGPAHTAELQRLVRLANDDDGDPARALAGLSALIRQAPRFAEAYNQRAILYFRAGHFERAIADCETVLRLNPHHFGAASGLARAYMRIKKPRAALKAFRTAYRINPGLEDIGETIRLLESVLDEDGKK